MKVEGKTKSLLTYNEFNMFPNWAKSWLNWIQQMVPVGVLDRWI